MQKQQSEIDELKKELRPLQERIDLELKAASTRQRVKKRVLKKGKEKQLQHYQNEMAQSQRKAACEITVLENKVQALEAKIEAIKAQNQNRLDTYYTPFINSLYDEAAESSDVEEVMKEVVMTQSYYALVERADKLKALIKLQEGVLQEMKEKEEMVQRSRYQEAQRRKEIEEEALRPEVECKNQIEGEYWCWNHTKKAHGYCESCEHYFRKERMWPPPQKTDPPPQAETTKELKQPKKVIKLGKKEPVNTLQENVIGVQSQADAKDEAFEVFKAEEFKKGREDYLDHLDKLRRAKVPLPSDWGSIIEKANRFCDEWEVRLWKAKGGSFEEGLIAHIREAHSSRLHDLELEREAEAQEAAEREIAAAAYYQRRKEFGFDKHC